MQKQRKNNKQKLLIFNMLLSQKLLIQKQYAKTTQKQYAETVDIQYAQKLSIQKQYAKTTQKEYAPVAKTVDTKTICKNNAKRICRNC
jgi:hypothetical protein